MDQKDFTPALGYHWMTGLYDLAIRLTMPEKRFRQKLVQETAPQPEESILEFGYGTGANLIKMAKASKNVAITGLDIDPKVRQIAIKKLENADLRQFVIDQLRNDWSPEQIAGVLKEHPRNSISVDGSTSFMILCLKNIWSKNHLPHPFNSDHHAKRKYPSIFCENAFG